MPILIIISHQIIYSNHVQLLILLSYHYHETGRSEITQQNIPPPIINNAVTQEKTLPQRGSVEGAVVYDLMGRRVTDLKPGSIYIRDGKKVMVK